MGERAMAVTGVADSQARANRVCVMPHLARIFFIAFASTTASCSSELAQKQAGRKEMGQQLTAAYYSCVRTSFASQRPTMVDRNTAIAQAFMVCQPEESKLQAFENTLSGNQNVSNAAILAHRNALKEELLRRYFLFRSDAEREGAMQAFARSWHRKV